MISQKIRIASAIILAVLTALLLATACTAFFPSKTTSEMPIPMPEPNRTYQLLWSLQWLGTALLVSLAIVATILLVSKIRHRRPE